MTQRRKYLPVKKALTAEQRARRTEALEWAEGRREPIVARGRSLRDQADRALPQAFELLKAERELQGLSLADLEAKTGINRPALSRLESAGETNATVSTLCRVAEALGKRLVVRLVNERLPK
jgi:hypothetical protein